MLVTGQGQIREARNMTMQRERRREFLPGIEVEEKLPTRNIILIYDTEYPQSIASKEFQKFLSSQEN